MFADRSSINFSHPRLQSCNVNHRARVSISVYVCVYVCTWICVSHAVGYLQVYTSSVSIGCNLHKKRTKDTQLKLTTAQAVARDPVFASFLREDSYDTECVVRFEYKVGALAGSDFREPTATLLASFIESD